MRKLKRVQLSRIELALICCVGMNALYVIIEQTTESLENKGFREDGTIHFHRDHDLFFSNARYAVFEGILC